MAYQQTQWNTGDPITQSRMNHIEEGIAAAHTLVSDAQRDANQANTVNDTQNSQISELQTGVSGINQKIGGEFDATHTVNGKIEDLDRRVTDSLTLIDQQTSQGSTALTELIDAGCVYDGTNKSITTHLKSIYATKQEVNTTINNAVQTPSASHTVVINNQTEQVNTLARRILHIYNTMDDLHNSIDHVQGDNDSIPSGLKQRIEEAERDIDTLEDSVLGTSGQNVTARLDHLDGGNIQSSADFPSRNVKDLITEIDNAHLSTALQTGGSAREFSNLDDRFENIENEIVGAHITNGATLNARFYNIDGGSVPTRTLPNVISEIASAHRTITDTLNDRFNAIDDTTQDNSLVNKLTTLQTNFNTSANDLDSRLDTVETTLNTNTTGLLARMTTVEEDIDNLEAADTAFDTRIDAIDGGSTPSRTLPNLITEVENARSSNVKGTTENNELTPHVYGSLDARLEAIETDIDTIAKDLDMYDSTTGEISDLHTRVDTIAANLIQMANEIGMIQDGAAVQDLQTAWSDSTTRIDLITNELNDARVQIGTDQQSGDPIMGTLDDRFDAIETRATTLEGTIGHETTGLAATKAIADEALTKANTATTSLAGKASTSSVEALGNRVDSLEGKVTVVIDNTNITYDNNGKPSNIGETPTQDKDYLLQGADPDTKYYYWKYLGESPNGSWELISGAGGSGTGNNNAEVFMTTQAFDSAAKAENKDYYVLDNQIWHHYRYIYDDVNTKYDLIEIGQNLNTNYLKRYNIAESEDNSVTYLDLYEFPYGTNKASENIDPVTDLSYRIAHIALPQGGGGIDETEYRLYGRVIGDQTIRKSVAEVQADGGKVILRFGYTCYAKTGEGENDYGYKRASYVLTAEDGTVIKSSNGSTINYLTKNEYAANNYSPDLVFDVTNYYTINETNAFTLTLTADVGNNVIKTKSIDVYVNIIQLSLTSTFTDANSLSIYNSVEIPFTFNGMENTDYTIHVLFDNQPITFTINRGRIIIAPNQLANQIGVHTLQIYASQVVNNETLNSNNLYYQLGLTGADSQNSIMLFSGTSLDISEVEQYKILNLPYTLYIPNGIESTQTITIRIDQVDSTYTTTTGNPIIRNENLTAGKWKYPFRINKMYAANEYYLVTISCTNANTLIFKVHVKQAEEQIEIRSNNLVFNFDPMNDNYTNTLDLEHRLWQQTKNGITYKMRIPEGAHFDWRTGGWTTIKDENNNDISCFCVKAGSRVEFVKRDPGTSQDVPLTLFWHDMETAGSNFKCVFKIDNVKSPTAQFLTSLDNTEHRITQYGNWVEDKYQDTDLKKTLLSTYLNVKTNYIYYYNIDKLDEGVIPETDDGDGAHDDKLGTTVLASENVSTVEAIRAADETDARKKNQKKIKEYIHNIYTIISQIDPSANYNGTSYKTFLLTLLQGNETLQEEEEGKDPVEEAIIRNLMTLTDGKALVATQVYKNLMGIASGESAADIALMTAYREYDAPGFNAITNGFVVEGKEKKDGIIAKLQFYIKAITKSFTPMGNAAVQTISAEPISTNPNAHTKIYRVIIGIPNEQNIIEEPRIYEVNIAEVYDNNTFLWNKVAGLRDATVTESHRYGLELNASGSYMYLPTGTLSYAHSEGDIIEFEYNVNSELENHIDSSVIIYEDGVPSAADIYTRGKGIFEQYDSTNNLSTAQSLTIGSDECDVYIFKMRLYDEALENSDILANFYADGLTPDDMSERYNRNKKLVDVTSAGREITPSLVAEACPDLRVIMIEAPRLTGGKTSFIKDTKIRCIYKNGRPEDNWVALNAYHAGQGTSSDNYGAAGRNLDIMFGFDGEDIVIVPKPQKNNYSFDPSYVSTLIKGIDNTLEANQDTILDEATYRAQSNQYQITTNGKGTISLNASSVPNNWFNIKLNIASSENVNNAYLQKRFDTYLPYKDIVPARKRGRAMNPQLDIKNDMEFVNCVVFIKETGTPSEFTNDKGENRSWHFYGIGNIGDSKKTDTTRINVPGDPQEFAVELSDNGLKNSEFSTGVFYTPLGENETYTEHELSLTPTTAHECTASEYTNDNGYALNISEPSTSTLYLIKEELTKYTRYHRFMYINSQFVEIGRPIAFENLEVGIRYPISRAEWKTSLNTYQKQLNNSNRAKGWDKSFEFRYDLTTKDGETIERNELEKVMNDMHQEVNKQKFVDLYEWIVMSSNDDFKNHLSDWFIEKSPLYWYLFTERYTMIDSRAKNTFYHYGKIYISDDEYNGIVLNALNEMTAEQYLAAHNEIVAKGNITALQIAASELAFQQATAQSIYDNRDTFLRDDPANNSYPSSINNGYRFELWDYDNDTALGINNNGQMVFDAGLEDIDKTTSGWVYNAAESVIWCRIRDNMYDKLSQLYIQLKATDCFNDESLIEQFDTLQEQFPEELWRLDFERKYFRPFKDSGETTYLSSMANGRKKYQRRQFERNMAIYISSKYLTNASYIARDQISFRPNRDIIPANEAIITVKPYSTMYINFMIGNAENDYEMTDTNAKSGHIRVKANEAYQIHARDFVDRFQNFQCVIYNACRIMAIEGIDKFECKQFIFSNAKKLTTLKLGGDHENSGNVANIGDLGLNSEIPLLEELDISNIRFTSPPAELSLDRFPLLKKFNAENSNIQHFTFKDGGMIEEIKYFPSDMDKINFKNLYKLSTVEFQENANFSNLSEYTSENSFSDSYSIVTNMINSATITKLMLNDIDWTITDLIELAPLIQLKQRLGNNMLLQGTITVTGQWSQVKKDDYDSILGTGNIHWICESAATPEYKLRFYASTADISNVDDSNVHYIAYVSPSSGSLECTIGSDPVYVGACERPTKNSTVSTEYIFGDNPNTYYQWAGWSMVGTTVSPNNGTIITDNADFVAKFIAQTRRYPLYWLLNANDTTPIVDPAPMVDYGGSYEGGIAPTVLDLKLKGKSTATINTSNGTTCSYSIFKGWQKEPINLDSTFLRDINGQTAFCIYGDWLTGTETIDTIKAQQDIDAKKLFTFAHLTDHSELDVGSKVTIPMGYDNNTGITIIGKNATQAIGPAGQIYDGTNGNGSAVVFQRINNAIEPSLRPTNITPFSDMTNRGFTLAIDYHFNADYISSLYGSSGYIILCGCYDTTAQTSATAQGFAVYYDCANKISKVCFGNLRDVDTYSSSTSSCVIANTSGSDGRNIVVIRHRADTNILEVYSGNRTSIITSLNENSIVQSLTWSKNTSNAPLCFGHFTNSTFNALTNTVFPGVGGVIHWAKYWNNDLGKNECTLLASWIHEDLTFAIEDYTNDGVQDVINTESSNLFLSALQLSQYGGPTVQAYSGHSDGQLFSWGSALKDNSNSLYKKLANQRFFCGLPILYQSITNQTVTSASVIEQVFNETGHVYKYKTSNSTTDLALLPALIEAGGSSANYYDEAHLTMPWNKAINTRVITYDGTSFDLNNVGHNAKYMNLRCFGVPINITVNKVYTGYTGTAPVYNNITEIQRGDVFIQTIVAPNGTTSYMAYVYATEEDKRNGAPCVTADSGTLLYCSSGGWIKARPWWLRSVAYTYTQQDGSMGSATENPFYFIDSIGEINFRSNPSTSSTEGAGAWFVYEFGIR